MSLVFALAAGLLFCNGLGGGFLLDDKPTISENPAVQIAKLDSASLMQAAYSFNAGGGSRALPMLTFGLDYWRAGLDPAAFKATNIIIHVLTMLGLAGFFRLLLPMAGFTQLRSNYVAPALALAWAIHPLQVSAVLYVVQRMQIMGTLFLVLALCAYLKMRQAHINNERSRHFGVVAGLFWVLALASKEDSILLPVYTLALEFTVLQFRAAQPSLARGLRRGYLVATLLGTSFFLLVVLPQFWSREPYPYRDFSSIERLLTQGRVLVMYLGQTLMPQPDWLPFYYDDLTPSRGLWQPHTTLFALLVVFALLVLAWCLRKTRPLFALGIFLFFAGHFVSSNVIGLELAFEHRNHFPLIGVVLAVGDLLAIAFGRLQLQPRATMAASMLILAFLGGSTLLRAREWGTPLGFAEYSTRIAPTSERAWNALCETHFELSGSQPDTPHFEKALEACSKGAAIPYGAASLNSLLILKTINGSARQSDWDRLIERVKHAPMTPLIPGVAWHLVRYSNGDVRIDPAHVILVIDLVGKRIAFPPDQYAGLGYYAAQKKLDADAYRYFALAVQNSPPRSKLPAALVAELTADGYLDLAHRVDDLANAKEK